MKQNDISGSFAFSFPSIFANGGGFGLHTNRFLSIQTASNGLSSPEPLLLLSCLDLVIFVALKFAFTLHHQNTLQTHFSLPCRNHLPQSHAIDFFATQYFFSSSSHAHGFFSLRTVHLLPTSSDDRLPGQLRFFSSELLCFSFFQ